VKSTLGFNECLRDLFSSADIFPCTRCHERTYIVVGPPVSRQSIRNHLSHFNGDLYLLLKIYKYRLESSKADAILLTEFWEFTSIFTNRHIITKNMPQNTGKMCSGYHMLGCVKQAHKICYS